MADLTITEVSKKYDLKADTLRYYERIGLIPSVPRQSNGNRYYPDDLQSWIEMIVCLRHSGVTIETLIDYAHLMEQGDATLDAREELLREQLALLEQKRHNLDRSINRLQHKISLYETGEIKKQKSYFDEYRILDDQKTKE
ncbi:MerR family transcriptional regulator [Limosilactobacillus difficilis]|uniref:MerR family transcriptional regulator n=1 Tax=Limosilactobacillus difficilis TaxID=2991838 RepID=UPI0024BB4D01|nr:MerR family transcriptional regulator [Limosilactobacillus difficilis]